MVQVDLRIGEGVAHGLLGAGEHDGLGAVLNEVGERRRGVGHSVGAVQDHKAIVRVVVLADDLGDAQPVGGAHIGAVDVHGLHDVEFAQAFDLGHAAGELLAGESGGETVAVLGGGEGAAGGVQEEVLRAGSFALQCGGEGAAGGVQEEVLRAGSFALQSLRVPRLIACGRLWVRPMRGEASLCWRPTRFEATSRYCRPKSL